MNLDNVQHEYNPGEVIMCSAEGNPEPEIRWVDDVNFIVSKTHILTIEASMETTQTYRCLATNNVRGTLYSMLETITFNGIMLQVRITFLDVFSGLSKPFVNCKCSNSNEVTDFLQRLTDYLQKCLKKLVKNQ